MSKFILEENLFPDKLRNKLPINLYLLRIFDKETRMDEKNNVSKKASNSFYNIKDMKVGIYYKSISNIL